MALTGPLTVVLFLWALGLAPPRLTQTYVAVGVRAGDIGDELVCPQSGFLERWSVCAAECGVHSDEVRTYGDRGGRERNG